MVTILSPPNTKIPVGNGNRKYYTLHHYEGKTIFTIQKNSTAILAFRNKNDCMHFGKLLESHYELTREWPQVDFENTLLFKNTKSPRLKYLTVTEWSEFMLKMMCIRNAFSMLDIHDFEDNRLRGQYVQWDMIDDFYIDALNQKWKDS